MRTRHAKMPLGGLLPLAVLTLCLVSPGPAAEGIWTKKADMPTPRLFFDTCAVEGKIYAIGGALRPHVGCSALEEYDPVTDTWTRKANLSTERVGPGVSVVNGKIYAIGGAPLGAVEEHDPGTDTWMRKANMPTVRSFFTTSVVNGKIYAIGGALGTAGPAFSTVEAYDPATDTWARKANLPEPRYFHAAGVVDSKVYIIAGSWTANTASRAVYAYDPATDRWERKADAPTVGSWLSASVVDGRIYVFGIGAGQFPKGVQEYNPATDTWTTRADMPTARTAVSTCELNGKIYVVGGTATTAYIGLATVEEYTPNPLVVDFNSDGIVDIKDLLRLIESWGQAGPMVDIAPRPFGDGIVDAADLEILMAYWGQEIPDPTLMAHWRLDEAEGVVAFDHAGTANGVLVGNPVWQPTGGQVAGALQCDGVGGCVTTPFVCNPAQGTLSVFAWVQGGAPGQVILSQDKGANWLMLDPNGAPMTELKQSGRQGKPLTSAAVITDGAWHRVGLVWDGTNRTLYVDDIEVAKDTQTGLANAFGGLYIGAGSTLAPDTFWSGLIDEIRIYRRAVQP